jgi:Domain of unknown function (DUF1737)
MHSTQGLQAKMAINCQQIKPYGYDIDPHNARQDTMQTPPDGLATYRILTGVDDAAFCRRLSDAIALGYKLYVSPSATFND